MFLCGNNQSHFHRQCQIFKAITRNLRLHSAALEVLSGLATRESQWTLRSNDNSLMDLWQPLLDHLPSGLNKDVQRARWLQVEFSLQNSKKKLVSVPCTKSLFFFGSSLWSILAWFTLHELYMVFLRSRLDCVSTQFVLWILCFYPQKGQWLWLFILYKVKMCSFFSKLV